MRHFFSHIERITKKYTISKMVLECAFERRLLNFVFSFPHTNLLHSTEEVVIFFFFFITISIVSQNCDNNEEILPFNAFYFVFKTIFGKDKNKRRRKIIRPSSSFFFFFSYTCLFVCFSNIITWIIQSIISPRLSGKSCMSREDWDKFNDTVTKPAPPYCCVYIYVCTVHTYIHIQTTYIPPTVSFWQLIVSRESYQSLHNAIGWRMKPTLVQLAKRYFSIWKEFIIFNPPSLNLNLIGK